MLSSNRQGYTSSPMHRWRIFGASGWKAWLAGLFVFFSTPLVWAIPPQESTQDRTMLAGLRVRSHAKKPSSKQEPPKAKHEKSTLRLIWTPVWEWEKLLRSSQEGVIVPYARLMERWQAWLQQEAAKRQRKMPKAWVISTLRCEGIQQGRQAVLQMRLRLRIAREGWQEIILPTEGLAIAEARLEGIEGVLQAEVGRLRLLVWGAAEGDLVIEAGSPIRELPRGDLLRFRLPPAAITQLSLVLSGDQEVDELPSGLRVVPLKSAIQIQGALHTAQPLSLLLRPRKNISRHPVAVEAKISHSLRILADVQWLSAEVALHWRFGQQEQIALRLPKGFGLLDIQSAQLADFSVDPKDKERILVRLRPDASASKTSLTLRLLRREAATAWRWHPLVVEGAYTQSGHLDAQIDQQLRFRFSHLNSMRQEVAAKAAATASPRDAFLRFSYWKSSASVDWLVEKLVPQMEVQQEITLSMSTRQARLTSKVEIRARRGTLYQLRGLSPKGWQIYDFRDGAGKEIRFLSQGLRWQIELAQPLEEGKRQSFRIVWVRNETLPESGERRLALPRSVIDDAHHQEGEITLIAPPFYQLRLHATHQLIPLEQIPAPNNQQAEERIRLRIVGAAYDGALSISRKRPDIRLWSVGRYQVSDALLQGDLDALLRIQQAGIRGVKILVRHAEGLTWQALSPEVEITQERKSPQAGGAMLWELSFAREVFGRVPLTLRFRRRLQANEQQITLPILFAPDASATQHGFAVAGGERVSLQILPEGLLAVESEVLPPPIHPKAAFTPLINFQARQPLPTLQIRLRRYAAQEILQALVRSLSLEGELLASGELRMAATFSLRSQGLPFFEAILPEGSELWAAQLQGKGVKPLREKQRVRIPLYGGMTREDQVIRLFYTLSFPHQGRLAERFKAQAPTVSYPIQATHWRFLIEGSLVPVFTEASFPLHSSARPRILWSAAWNRWSASQETRMWSYLLLFLVLLWWFRAWVGSLMRWLLSGWRLWAILAFALVGGSLLFLGSFLGSSKFATKTADYAPRQAYAPSTPSTVDDREYRRADGAGKKWPLRSHGYLAKEGKMGRKRPNNYRARLRSQIAQPPQEESVPTRSAPSAAPRMLREDEPSSTPRGMARPDPAKTPMPAEPQAPADLDDRKSSKSEQSEAPPPPPPPRIAINIPKPEAPKPILREPLAPSLGGDGSVPMKDAISPDTSKNEEDDSEQRLDKNKKKRGEKQQDEFFGKRGPRGSKGNRRDSAVEQTLGLLDGKEKEKKESKAEKPKPTFGQEQAAFREQMLRAVQGADARMMEGIRSLRVEATQSGGWRLSGSTLGRSSAIQIVLVRSELLRILLAGGMLLALLFFLACGLWWVRRRLVFFGGMFFFIGTAALILEESGRLIANGLLASLAAAAILTIFLHNPKKQALTGIFWLFLSLGGGGVSMAQSLPPCPPEQEQGAEKYVGGSLPVFLPEIAKKEDPLVVDAKTPVFVPRLWWRAMERSASLPCRPAAPLGWWGQVHYEVRIQEGALTQGEAVFTLHLLNPQWQTIPLGLAGARLVEASVKRLGSISAGQGAKAKGGQAIEEKAIPLTLDLDQHGYKAPLQGAASFEVRLRFSLPEHKAHTQRLALSLAPMSAATARIRLPKGAWTITAQGAQGGWHLEEKPQETTVQMILGGSSSLDLRWTARQAVAQEAELPQIQSYHFFSLHDSMLRVMAKIQILRQFRASREAQILLPQEVRLEAVQGTQIRAWHTAQREGRTVLQVFFEQPLQQAELQLHYLLLLEKSEMRFPLPLIEPLSASRHLGFLGIHAPAHLQWTLLEAQHIEKRTPDAYAMASGRWGGMPQAAYAYERQPQIRVALRPLDLKQHIAIRAAIRLSSPLSRLRADVVVQEIAHPLFLMTLRIPADLQIRRIESKGGAPIRQIWLGATQKEQREIIIEFKQPYSKGQRVRIDAVAPTPEIGALLPSLAPQQAEKLSGTLVIAASPTLEIQTDDLQGLEAIEQQNYDGELPSSDQLNFSGDEEMEDRLSFKILAPYRLRVSVRKRRSEQQATLHYDAQVRSDALRLTVYARFRASGAGSRQFRLSVPTAILEQLEMPKNTGFRIQQQIQKERAVITLQSVSLRRQVDAVFAAHLPLPPKGGVFSLPMISAEETEQSDIFLALRKDALMRVALPTDAHKGLDEIAVSALPPEMQARLLPRHDPGVVAAFRVRQAPWSLRVDAQQRTTDVTVVPVVEMARLNTVMSPQGELWTQAHYRVRTPGLQMLPLRLPKDAQLWQIQIAGKILLPARSPNDPPERFLIPLPPRQAADLAYSIHVLYASALPLQGIAPTFDLPAPTLEGINVAMTFWEITLPHGWSIFRQDGNMEEASPLQAAYNELNQGLGFLRKLQQISQGSDIAKQRRAQGNLFQQWQNLRSYAGQARQLQRSLQGRSQQLNRVQRRRYRDYEEKISRITQTIEQIRVDSNAVSPSQMTNTWGRYVPSQIQQRRVFSPPSPPRAKLAGEGAFTLPPHAVSVSYATPGASVKLQLQLLHTQSIRRIVAWAIWLTLLFFVFLLLRRFRPKA